MEAKLQQKASTNDLPFGGDNVKALLGSSIPKLHWATYLQNQEEELPRHGINCLNCYHKKIVWNIIPIGQKFNNLLIRWVSTLDVHGCILLKNFDMSKVRLAGNEGPKGACPPPHFHGEGACLPLFNQALFSQTGYCASISHSMHNSASELDSEWYLFWF